MNLIEAMLVTASDITDSNIAAQDHSTWLVGSSYDTGDYVCAESTYQVGATLVTGYLVYQSRIDSNVGNDPTTDDGSQWLDLGPTNRLRAWDGTIGSKTENSGTIEFEILTTTSCNAIAFFGLVAGSITVEVRNVSDDLIYERTIQLYDSTEIDGFWDWFFSTTEYSQSTLIEGLPSGSGRKVSIVIDAGAGMAAVGAIALGTSHNIGITRPGTEVRIEDFSELNEDQYGNIAPVLRSQIRWVNFRFVAPTRNNERILRRVVRNSQKLVVAYQAEGAEDFGTLVYGIISDVRLPGESITSEGELIMRGIV